MSDISPPKDQQLTEWTLTDLRKALVKLDTAPDNVSAWPVTSDKGQHATAFARRVALKIYKGNPWLRRDEAEKTFGLWNFECVRGLTGIVRQRAVWWSDDQRKQFLDEAEEAARIEQQRREQRISLSTIRFRERRAAEEKAREERTNRASKVKELAERLGIGLRQARSIAAEGTTDPRAAKIAAEIFGSDESSFLRPIGKLGRPIDWERKFLALDIPGGTFDDFKREHPTADASWRDYLRWRLDVFGKLILGDDEFDFG